MNDNKMHLGVSPLTGNVYLGKCKGNRWIGEKRDVTNEFIGVLLQKFEPNTMQSISINGENKYRIIVVDIEKIITVDGKTV